MSKFGPLQTYECPFMDYCLAQIDQAHFQGACREVSEQPKRPGYLECSVYGQMQNTPRMWKQRIYSQAMDKGQSQARYRV